MKKISLFAILAGLMFITGANAAKASDPAKQLPSKQYVDGHVEILTEQVDIAGRTLPVGDPDSRTGDRVEIWVEE